MVESLSSLMRSFEDIANNRDISDNDYVYVKGGRAHTENRVSHWFTGLNRNASGVLQLVKELRTRYGNKICDSTLKSELFDFASGGKQMKVSDLRHVFLIAEAQQIEVVAEQIRAEHGNKYDDAFEPLVKQVDSNRVVASSDIRDLIRNQFGDDVATLVMAGRLGDNLKTLPELLKAASEMQKKWETLLPRGKQALRKFCLSGCNMTKRSIIAVFNKYFPERRGDKWNNVKRIVNGFPSTDISVERALNVFKKASELVNSGIIDNFINENKIDDDTSMALGLQKLNSNGVELTDALRNEMKSKLDAYREGIKRIRGAEDEVFRQVAGANAKKSEKLKIDSNKLAVEFIEAARFSDKDLTQFKLELETRVKRETNYDFGLNYELNVERKPAWNDKQKQLFKETMNWLHGEFPKESLFFSTAMETAVSMLKKGLVGFGDPESDAVIFKVTMLTGEVGTSIVAEKCGELQKKFPHGDFHVTDLVPVIYGDEAPVPNVLQGYESVVKKLGKQTDALIWKTFKSHVPEAVLVEKKWLEKFIQDGMPDAEAKAAAEESAKGSYNKEMSAVFSAISGGFTLEKAVTYTLSKVQEIHFDDFAIKPHLTTIGMETPALAEKQWFIDFARQGGIPDEKKKVGTTSITVKLPDSAVHVHNGSEGLAPGEFESFSMLKPVEKHQKVLRALRQLCGDNDRLYTNAVVSLTQSGLVTFAMGTAGVIEGGGGSEHASLSYVFEKNEGGDIVVTARTPKGVESAVLDARLVLHPDGSSEYTKVDVWSPAKWQEQLEAEAKAKNEAQAQAPV